MSFDDMRDTIKMDVAALKNINPNDIKKDIMGYQRLALEVVEHNPLALQYIEFISEHPESYQPIVIAAIKKEPDACKFINKAFMDQFPDCYMRLLLGALSKELITLYTSMQGWVERSIFRDISTSGKKLISALRSIDRDWIKKYPNQYKTIAFEAVSLYAPAIDAIDKDSIAGYEQLVESAIENGERRNKVPVLSTIHHTYGAQHPQTYHSIALIALSIDHLSFRFITPYYMMKHPKEYRELALKAIEYRELALKAIEHQPECSPGDILSCVRGEYIIMYPDEYRTLILAALKKDINFVHKIDLNYRQTRPEHYNAIVLDTIKQDSNVFLKLDEKTQIMVLDEVAKGDEKKGNLVKELKSILDKSKHLYDKDAVKHAKDLYQNIANDFLRYCNPPPLYYGSENYSFQDFKADCTSHINKALPTLEHHRGWKKTLYNLGLAIAGVGIVYLAGCLVNWHATNGKHFFFDFPTDSMEKVSVLKDAVDNCESPTHNL